MTTILDKIEVTGKGLMKNRDCNVLILPSNEGKIRLFVENSPEPIILSAENVVATNHCVVLGNKKSKAMLTEHFTAACAFMGIDSIDVHMSKSEMPILDGSSKEWVDLFKKAGVEKKKREFYTVSEPIYYLNGKTHMVILPDDELNISYGVNYNHPDLTKRWVSFNSKKPEEIIVPKRNYI